MGTLMPEHDHFIPGNVQGWLDDLQHLGTAYQTRRHHGDKVRTSQYGHHEQELWNGKHHLARQTCFCKRIISHSMETAAIRRHNDMLQFAEFRERELRMQTRMIHSASKYIALGEQRTAAQSRRGAFASMEGKVYVTLFSLLRNP